MGQDPREIRAEIERTRARMGDTAEALAYKADVPARMRDAVDDRVETVRGTVNDVVGSVRSTVTQTSDKLGAALDEARRRAGDVELPDVDVRDAARRSVGMVAENPLGLALGALALGFLAGLMLPATGIERERIGPLRDDLLDRAQTAGNDAIVHGRAIVEETVQAVTASAQDSARAHARAVLDGGLDPSTLASTAFKHGTQLLRETAETAVQTAQQKLQEHGKAVLGDVRGTPSNNGELDPELDDELND